MIDPSTPTGSPGGVVTAVSSRTRKERFQSSTVRLELSSANHRTATSRLAYAEGRPAFRGLGTTCSTNWCCCILLFVEILDKAAFRAEKRLYRLGWVFVHKDQVQILQEVDMTGNNYWWQLCLTRYLDWEATTETHLLENLLHLIASVLSSHYRYSRSTASQEDKQSKEKFITRELQTT